MSGDSTVTASRAGGIRHPKSILVCAVCAGLCVHTVVMIVLFFCHGIICTFALCSVHLWSLRSSKQGNFGSVFNDEVLSKK